MKAAPAGHASYALPHPLPPRGTQVALTQEELDEAEQARLRVWVGIVAFGLCYVFQANQVWPLMLFFIGYTLVIFAWLRVRPQVTPSRRVLAIVGDITACSTVLYVGAEKTM